MVRITGAALFVRNEGSGGAFGMGIVGGMIGELQAESNSLFLCSLSRSLRIFSKDSFSLVIESVLCQ